MLSFFPESFDIYARSTEAFSESETARASLAVFTCVIIFFFLIVLLENMSALPL